MERKGNLFVLSGPSGAGKSTVITWLLKRLNNVYFSVSVTTREPRRGERDGIDYFFVSPEKFEEMIEKGEFLEYTKYVNRSYGTPAAPCLEKLEQGMDVILDIETHGAEQVLKLIPGAVGIFLFPGSYKILEERLRSRSTDSEEEIQLRLRQARIECEKAPMYKYIIINDRQETAAEEAVAIITAEKCKTADRLHYLMGD